MWDLRRFGEKTALIEDQGEHISYAALADEADAFAAYLRKKEGGERPLVFIFCRNSIGCLLGYVSCLEHGAVPLLLDERLDEQLVKRLVDTYQPDFLYLPRESSIGFLESDWGELDCCRGYRLLAGDQGSEVALNPALALLLPTSGSTGSPKLVRVSHTNLRDNTRNIAAYLELDENERPITTLPPQYTYGLSVINSHLWVGATILMTGGSVMSREFWRFFREEQATSLAGVPYIYQVLNRIGFMDWELPSLRILTQAGGRLGSDLHESFGRYAEKNHVRFYVMYGQTEATARMSYLPPERTLEKNDSIGIALPGGTFHLEDEEGEMVLETGHPGELVYTGKNVTMGYAKTREDLAKGDERGGVLHTQDIAVRDSDGYYRIVGRTKRFLKLFGKRYNLDELESLLIQRTGHQDCRCTGSDDRLCVYLTDGTLEPEVETYLKEHLDLSRSVFRCHVIPEIPLKANQKTDYQKLNGEYENDRKG